MSTDLVDHLPMTSYSTALVPQSYAEKAMASLMQLHSELMDEKERRVDLFRRLMEREQALAELRMYVQVLEEKLKGSHAPANERPAPAAPAAPSVTRAYARVSPAPAPAPPRVAPPSPEGWKSW